MLSASQDHPGSRGPDIAGERGIAHVALRVRDAARTEAFYRDGLGLRPMGEDGDGAVRRLGDGSRVLVELRHDPAARPRDPGQAGLFHTAILLPARSDLGAWLRHAAQSGLALTGASDHGVSEAIYLDDPEGNGVEIYWDRPAAEWPRDGDGGLRMFSHRLDLPALSAASTAPWQGAPHGTVIGHVHLQVGQLEPADRFLTGDLGLTPMLGVPGAGFYGWNGYHHHIAVNTWNSAGAGPRDPGMAGLDEVLLRGGATGGTIDPWGTPFAVT